MKHFLKKTSIVTLVILAGCGKDDDQAGPVNSAPKMSAQTFTFSEDLGSNHPIGKVVATDAEKDALTFSIATNDNALFEITTKGDLSLASGKSLDYETAASHSITVKVSDGELSTNAKVTINVLDAEENVAPEISDQSFDVPEALSYATPFATVVATDANGHSLIYTLDDNSTFEFSPAINGKLQLVSGKRLDFETKTKYELQVTVSDGVLSDTAIITINVYNVNEMPQIRDSSFVNDVREDIADDAVIAEIVAADPDGDNITYTVSYGDPDNLFEFDANGILTLSSGKSLDYETKAAHVITVRATDDGGLYAEETITIKVIDVDESANSTTTTLVGSTSGGSGDIDGTGIALFNTPSGIAEHGGFYYVADRMNHKIRKINRSTLEVTTFAGSTQGFTDGTGTAAMFNEPRDIIVDAQGTVYVADTGNNVIRKITANGEVTTFAGSGNFGNVDAVGTAASFSEPKGLCFLGSDIYVADTGNHTIRKITQGGAVTTYAGSPGTAGYGNGDRLLEALFDTPTDIIADSGGTLYVSDSNNHVIRSINGGVTVRLYAGVPNSFGYQDGPVNTGRLKWPEQITIGGPSSRDLYIVDRGNHAVRKVISVVSGGGGFGTSRLELVTVAGGNGIGNTDGNGSTAQLNTPFGILSDADAPTTGVVVTNWHSIRKIEE
ncbi:MAG: hypothetical protein GYB37_13095 [Algicola sp.]|nr:hypothetical protein [Algicola sp.]